jgi:hypothetical protein
MAGSVQKYIDLALSIFIGNKSGTDNFLRLPDDWRKLSDQKITTYDVSTNTIAYHATTETIISKYDGANNAASLIFTFFSHPVAITNVNGTNLANAYNTSFYGVYRDRAGKIDSPDASTIAFKFKNNLSTASSYLTAGAGAAVTVYTLQVIFE